MRVGSVITVITIVYTIAVCARDTEASITFPPSPESSTVVFLQASPDENVTMTFSPATALSPNDELDVYLFRRSNSSKQDRQVSRGYFNHTSQTAIVGVRESKLRNKTFYYIGIIIVVPGQMMNKTKADLESGTVLVKRVRGGEESTVSTMGTPTSISAAVTPTQLPPVQNATATATSGSNGYPKNVWILVMVLVRAFFQ